LLAAVNGTQLYYERAGSGEPLVLVHGGGGDRRYWDGQFLEMARHYDVLRYDLRGYGSSVKPTEGQPYRHEDDLVALLGELDISRAHVAGFSLGCQITVDAYTLYPEVFQSIVAVGPYVSGFSSPASDQLVSGYGQSREAFERSGARGAAEHFVNLPAFNPDRIDPGVKARLMEICSEYSWWWTTHRDPLEPVRPAAVEVLQDLRAPLLIISAEYDAAACREVADLLEETVPRHKRVDISGASHFMLMERPAVFNAAVLEFLRDPDPAGI
jgi:pimeloyl-ACP methyl ester carboxylesterase